MQVKKEKLIGARIPEELKKVLDRYCNEHGIKMNFFVTQAVKEKLLEVIEDEDDMKVINERLKEPDFASPKEFNEYLISRGIKL